MEHKVHGSDKSAWVVTGLTFGTLKKTIVFGLKPKPSRGEPRDSMLSMLKSWNSVSAEALCTSSFMSARNQFEGRVLVMTGDL